MHLSSPPLPRLSEAQIIAALENGTLALGKACLYEASSQRGDLENSQIVTRSVTWLTMASLSVA